MKKVLLSLVLTSLVVAVSVAAIRKQLHRLKKPTNQSTIERFEIPDWDVSVPVSLFDRKPPKSYLVANYGVGDRREGIVFLDASLDEIAKESGQPTIDKAKSCIAYYHSIMRLPSSADLRPEGPAITTLDGYEYRPIAPSASCLTEPGDHSLDAFDAHVVSGSAVGGSAFEVALLRSLEKL